MTDEQKEIYEAFSSLDKGKIIAYLKRNDISIPENEEKLWIIVHNVICRLFLLNNVLIERKQFNASYDWLVEHGYTFNAMEEYYYKKERYLKKTIRKRLSNEEKFKIMIDYINETGQEITAETKYKGYNIGYLRNNLRQMYYNGNLKIDKDLLDRFIEAKIIPEEKERIRTSQQEKYEFLIAFANKSKKVKEKAKMKNGLTYKLAKHQLQIDYNRNNIKLTNEQIEELRKQNILGYSKEEIKRIEETFQMPKKYVLDIMKKYASIEEFKELYKKCQCDYDFKDDIFCGFKGIVISNKNFTEYQKLQYALVVKDLLKLKLCDFEYNTGKYIDIEYFNEMINTIEPKRSISIYMLNCGLDGKKYTMTELAKEFNISKSRVKSIIDNTKRKLSHPSRRKNLIRDYRNDLKEIEKYDDIINELKIEITDLQTIKDFLNENNFENIKNVLIDSSIKKEDVFKDKQLCDIQALIEKYYNKIKTRQNYTELYELELSVRTYHCLYRARIRSIADLINLTESELKKIRNMGDSSYNEVINKLSSIGLQLKGSSVEDNYEDYKDISNMKDYFQACLKRQLIEWDDINNKIEFLKRKIIQYYKAVKQYLNEEDIFDKKYIVKIDNIKIEDFEVIKKALNELEIIDDDI